jgi:NADPH:quinone reductase-like Zn-dependent oxidoreductase
LKAIIIRRFGSADVLEYAENLPIPDIQDHEVLIKVKAAGINPLDIRSRNGGLRFATGAKFPIILGNDVSGIIEKCGSKVENFKAGDAVFCMADANRRFSLAGFAKSGTYAEYCVTREDTLARKPEKLSFEEAAALPIASMTAYQALVKKARIKRGDTVLVNGASGGVGIFAVQIAKAYGASVTALCSGVNFSLLEALGADHIVDYHSQDIGAMQERFDIIYDVAATSSYSHCRTVLKPHGIYVSNVATPATVVSSLLLPLLGVIDPKQRLRGITVGGPLSLPPGGRHW